MRNRVLNPNNTEYRHYGGRGIKICERWDSVENFIEDMYPSFVVGLTLNRIDPNGNYCPENCNWATESEQGHFKRKREGCSSQYIGVSLSKRNGRFIAAIAINGKKEGLGSFLKEIDAAIAYDNRSEEIYGDRPNKTSRKTF